MTESEWWQTECARLRVELATTERARQAAEEERDDVVRAARLRDDRDRRRRAALATLRVALDDALAALLENA
jgi:hypothetical protein